MHRSLTVRVLALALAALGATAAVQAQGPKIAVIDVQRIVTDSAQGKAAMDKLKKLQDQKQAQAQQFETELNGLQDQIAKGRLTLADDKLAAMQKDLEDKAIAYRRFQDDAQRELGKARDEELGAIERQVIPIIDQIGKEQGYTLIFNKFQSGLVFADPATDITEAVVQRFNTAPAAKPAAAPKP